MPQRSRGGRAHPADCAGSARARSSVAAAPIRLACACRQLGGDRDGDRRRPLAPRCRHPIGHVIRSMRARARAARAQPPLELRALRREPIRPTDAKSPRARIAETARSRAHGCASSPGNGCRRRVVDHVAPGCRWRRCCALAGTVAGNHASSRVDPGDLERQRRQHPHQRPPDVAGAEEPQRVKSRRVMRSRSTSAGASSTSRGAVVEVKASRPRFPCEQPSHRRRPAPCAA